MATETEKLIDTVEDKASKHHRQPCQVRIYRVDRGRQWAADVVMEIEGGVLDFADAYGEGKSVDAALRDLLSSM